MLQCRSGKRTGKGAVRIAVDMVNEGLIDTRTAIMRVEPQHLDQLLHPQVWYNACAYRWLNGQVRQVGNGSKQGIFWYVSG